MARGLGLTSSTLKVLKAVAELQDTTPGDLLERIVLDALAGKVSFEGEALLAIRKLMDIYGAKGG